MNKIAIIIPYFGKFPVWMDLYLYSCSKNPFIDFFFYTNCQIPQKIYPNTIFKSVSFEDYCSLISEKLGINFVNQMPYKLCDVKSFYGIIHGNLLSQYDFWGFGDLDLVYGDLSKLLSEKRQKKYDLITTHADRVAGHFTVIRTKSKYTQYCLKISRWKEKLESNDVYGLDEIDYTKLIYPQMDNLLRGYRLVKKILRDKICLYDFLCIPNNIRNIFSTTYIKEYYTSILPKSGEMWSYNIKNGLVINNKGKEIPYLHFLFFKKTQFWKTDTYWKDNYWQVPHLDFTNSRGIITFTNEKVVYKDINI